MTRCRLWGWVSLLLGLAFIAGCTPQVPGRFVAESIPVPDDVSLYTTEAPPDGAVGGPGVERLQVEVAGALVKRGDHAEADGALSATASWLLSEVNKGHTIDLMAIETASRHFGFGGILISFAAFGMQQQDAWREQLERAASNMPITRYGIRVSPSGRSAAVLFGSVELSYEAIPRALDPGQSVTLKGQVGPRFTFAHVYLTKPDGTVDEKRMPKRALDASFPLEAPGKYRLEVMGDGVSGPVVLSNVPLYVGVPEPAATIVAGAVVEPDEAEARLLVLLNEARAAAGVNQVQPDAELREIALDHSTDMADHHFFGHVSPTSGTPQDRVRRSGVLVSATGENVATAPTPELAHEGLMGSPGHRANMLRPDWTHVGIGVRKGDGGARGNDGACTATESCRAPNQRRSNRVCGSRLCARGKNLPAASVDPIYRVAARPERTPTPMATTRKASSRLSNQRSIERSIACIAPARGACQQGLELLELSVLAEIPALSDPRLRRYGVGLHVRRDSKGARSSTLFLLEGVSCK